MVWPRWENPTVCVLRVCLWDWMQDKNWFWVGNIGYDTVSLEMVILERYFRPPKNNMHLFGANVCDLRDWILRNKASPCYRCLKLRGLTFFNWCIIESVLLVWLGKVFSVIANCVQFHLRYNPRRYVWMHSRWLAIYVGCFHSCIHCCWCGLGKCLVLLIASSISLDLLRVLKFEVINS